LVLGLDFVHFVSWPAPKKEESDGNLMELIIRI